MAPARTKKRKTSSENEPSARPQTVAPHSPARTPMRSPQKRIVSITEAQKQALIDNLQLEVTERARKLRAQYALQAQSLRTRIELRINRIPTSLRKANMGELHAKYKGMLEARPHTVSEERKPVETENADAESRKRGRDTREIMSTAMPPPRGVKRNSDAMESADKENASEPVHDIPNPKKRSKAMKGPSRQVTNPSTVLSPKSANSRTLPQSPVRPILGSPQKSYLTHPASPLKPFSPIKSASPAKAAAAAATANLAAMVIEKPKVGRPKAGAGSKATNASAVAKGGTLRAKRGAVPEQEPEDVRKVSNTSNISSASNTTTIVKNTKKAPNVGSKKNDIGVRAVGKKVAAGADAPPPGRRVLRKRG